jgi:hypothetical protein
LGTAGVVRGVMSFEKLRESLEMISAWSCIISCFAYSLWRSLCRVSGLRLSNFIAWGNFMFSSRTTISFVLPSSVGVFSESKVGGPRSDGAGEGCMLSSQCCVLATGC